MTKVRTESEWRALVQELDVSGASVRDFAERRRLNMGTVAWWRSYFRRQRREPRRCDLGLEIGLVATARAEHQHRVTNQDGLAIRELALLDALAADPRSVLRLHVFDHP